MDARHLLVAGLFAALLLAGCTGPGGDSDGDGLPDVDEEEPREIKIRTADGVEWRNVTSDPNVVDTDDDGLSDFDEFQQGTDPRAVDTDGDRLLDGGNVTGPSADLQMALDEANVVRIDGVWVGEQGYCPSGGSLDPTNWDSARPQGNGLSDGEEVLGWNATPRDESYHVRSNPCLRDTDGDGLHDRLERERSTDPTDSDTDGDGVDDRFDADPLWDLHVTFELDTIELKQDKDTGGGADIRIDVQVDALRDTVWENVSQTGTYQLGEAWTGVDVDDESPEYHQKEAPVFLQAVDGDDLDDDDPIAITADGNQASLTVDLFEETVRLDGSVVGTDGSGSIEGADARITFGYETVRE